MGSWKKFILDGDSAINIGTAGVATGSLVFNGTTSGAVTIKVADVAGTYTLTLPTDDGTSGQQLTTDGNGVLTWANAQTATALDDIGDPDADTSISVAGYETTITSTLNEASHSVLIITDTTADLTADVTLLKLTYTDDGDANGTFIECLDNLGADSKFKVGANGDVFLGTGAKIDFGAGDVTLTHSANTLTFAGGTTLDLAQMEVLGLVLDNASAAPNNGTEVEGQIYYDTDDNHPYIWVV